MTDALAAARVALHLDRPCPRCGALFSWPCRTSSGKYRPRVHVERLAVEVQEALF
jgi:hypothetical protein